eukprot:2733341-Amphidinium_carterae.1
MEVIGCHDLRLEVLSVCSERFDMSMLGLRLLTYLDVSKEWSWTAHKMKTVCRRGQLRLLL